jgi:diaminobutyrate-2-oxoglutarate transaminase
VLVLSKAVGGGFPLAVIVYDKALDRWPRGMHAGTFRGNQIAMVAGKVTMEILRRDRLAEHANQMGALLMNGLRQIATIHPELGDVRGRGLMIGIEVIAPAPDSSRGKHDGALSAAIKRAAFDHGLLIETGGRHGSVLRMLPPLILTPTDVGAILDRLEVSVAFAKRHVRRP